MYYLIKKNKGDNYSVIEIENTTDATYHKVKEENYAIAGQWGRPDYIHVWKDYYNGLISKEELSFMMN